MFKKNGVNEVIPYIVICLVSIVYLWASPLAVGNPWVDTNVMLEIGKSWLNGVVPFRDIFEQRGPVLYVIYALTNIVSSYGYIGLFLVELVNLTAMYVGMRLILMTVTHDKDKSRYLALVVPIGMLASPSFQSGGSPEEFATPFILFAIYAILMLIRKRTVNRYAMIFGLLAAFAFWMKYTTVIPFVPLFVWWFLTAMASKNKAKLLLGNVGYMVSGFAIVSFIVMGYFWSIGGLEDLIEKYFIVNLTTYTGDTSFFTRVFGGVKAFVYMVARHWASVGLGAVSMAFLLKRMKKKDAVIGIGCTWLFTLVVINSMGVAYEYYYLLVLTIGLVLVTLGLAELALVGWRVLFLLPVMVALPFFTNPYAQSVPYIWQTDSLTAKKFANEIKANAGKKKVSVLYYSTIATGIDRYVDTAHPFYFFEKTNIPRQTFPDQQNYLEKVVKHKSADYVVIGLNYSLPTNLDLRNEKAVMAAIPPNVKKHYEIICTGGSQYPERGSGLSWRMSREFQTALLEKKE